MGAASDPFRRVAADSAQSELNFDSSRSQLNMEELPLVLRALDKTQQPAP